MPLARTRNLSRDEHGVSVVVGAMLVISLVFIAMSIYVSRVVPGYERAYEAAHMHEVRGVFLDLHSAILNHETKTINLAMAAERAFLGPPPASSRLTVTPARAVKRFEPAMDAWVGEPNLGGNDNYLWVRSDNTDNNRRTYLKFDLPNELQGVSSRSVVKAWLVVYCENVSKFHGAPWGDSSVTIEKWGYMPTLPILVEVREVPDSIWDEDTITWPGPTYGDTIKAVDWPNEDNHGVTENEVWYTWDVTTWVREHTGENVSFMLKAAYEDSTQNRYAKFSSKDRTGLGWSWSVPAGKDNTYPDPHLPSYPKPHLTVIYENWQGGRLYPGAPVFDNWGAFIEGGTIRFDTNYRNFPAHNFIFESGALVQQQWGYAFEFMIADPGLVVGERTAERDDDNIIVYVNRYRIVNRDRLTTSADIKLKVTVRENWDFYDNSWEITSDGPMRRLENVLITINTDYEWQWKYYLRDLTGVGKGFNVGDWEGGLSAYVETPWGDQKRGTADFQSKFYVDRNVRMYIFGLEWDPSVKDIFYYDRTYDVEVEAIV